MYSKIHTEIKPTETSAKLTYVNSFDAKFSLLLRETISITLVNMQEAALEVESNLMATNKLRNNSDYHGEDKKKKKEMSASTLRTKVADSKMDDMIKLIKNLSAKINRLEMKNRNQNKHIQDSENKNPNQFRRPFNPRFLRRDRKNNEDQKIHPPFQNNLIQDDESYEIDEVEVEDMEPDIDQLDDVSSSHFLTRSDYHYAKMVDYHETYNFEKGSYMPEIYQEMQHTSYGLRSGIKHAAHGKKNARNVPAKQGLSLEKKHDQQGSGDRVVET